MATRLSLAVASQFQIIAHSPRRQQEHRSNYSHYFHRYTVADLFHLNLHHYLLVLPTAEAAEADGKHHGHDGQRRQVIAADVLADGRAISHARPDDEGDAADALSFK